MVYTCEYDPTRDIMKTVPDMAINLEAAIESGVVLDTGMIAEHNDIDSPSSVIGRVRDVFDAFEAQKNILAKGRIESAPAPSATPSTSPEV